MLAIKECTTQLAQLGKPVDAEDITSQIINGLDYNLYKPVIDAVRARDVPISFELFHEKLIQHELTIKNQPPSNNTTTFNPSAHAAYTRPFHTNQRYPPSTNANQPRQQYQNHHNSQRGSTNNNPNPNPFKDHCQYCRATGHVVRDCPDFKRDYPNVVFPSPPTRQSRPTAHTATTTAGPSSSYLIDSGASHHITNDLNTLAFHTLYDGPDDLVIGDGSSLSISHHGNQDGGNSA